MNKIKIQQDRFSQRSNGKEIALLNLVTNIERNSGVYTQTNSVSYIGRENLANEEAKAVIDTRNEMSELFKASGVFEGYLPGADSETIDTACNIATETFMQLKAGYQYHKRASTKPTGDDIIESPLGDYVDYQTTWDYNSLTTNSLVGKEAFNPVLDSTLMAGIATAQSLSLVEAPKWLNEWFPPVVMSATVDGITIPVTISHLVQGGVHNADGSANPAMVKTSLANIVTDHNALNKVDATWVLPYAPSTLDNKYIVSDNVMGSKVRVINSIDHPTRPYKYNTVIPSMLGLSQNPVILKNGHLDDTDALHTNILIGEIGWRLQVITGRNTATPVKKEVIMFTDVQLQPNSKLNQLRDGQPQEYVGVMKPNLTFSDKSVGYLGTDHIAVASALRTILGLDADAGFAIECTGSVTMSINVERSKGSIETAVSDNGIVGVKDGLGRPLSTTLLDTPTTLVKFDFKGTNSVTGQEEDLGCLPIMKRLNNNWRTEAIVVDSTVTFTHTFVNYLGSAFDLRYPIDIENNGAFQDKSVNELKSLLMYRAQNNGFAEIKRLVSSLRNGQIDTHSANLPALKYGVKPRLIEIPFKISEAVVALDTSVIAGSVAGALRGLLYQGMTRMFETANFLAALQVKSGDFTKFKILVLTSPKVKSFMMESGDARMLGPEVEFSADAVLFDDIKDTIYMTIVENQTADGSPSPLNHGVRMVSAPVVGRIQQQTTGAIIERYRIIPKDTCRNLTPVIVEIKIDGLDDIFLSRVGQNVPA